MQHLQDLCTGDWLRIFTVKYFYEVNDRSSKYNDNSNYVDFVQFPKRHGFEIQDDYTLCKSGYFDDGFDKMNLNEFLQEWLFFQLISCVVREGCGPILTREQLICHGSQLDTRHLNQALTKWHDHLKRRHEEDPAANTMRLLEANQMLELAKQVVIANLAERPSRLVVPLAEEGEPGPDDDDDEEDEDEDKRTLCYMVLGETLSAVLVHTIRKCNVVLPGWEPDDLGGWGPPAYVYKKMQRDGWCPRSQTTIRGQLGRNATLSYLTACAHEMNRHHIHGKHYSLRQSCNSKQCLFIEAERAIPGVEPKYEMSHSPNCTSGEKCSMVGPDEEAVLDILEKSESQMEKVFPLLRIVDRDDGEKGIEVEEWTQGTSFATLSHVWSQGLGNRTARKIQVCQLEMIETWVKTAFGDEEYKGQLFWIDTFAIPQKKPDDPRRDRLKRRAIGLIPHIFLEARHCIIIDRYILDTLRSFHDSFAFGATLLACGWMTRLWTLQEAAMSAQLHLATRDNHGLRSLDDLWKHTGVEDVVHLSMAHMVQRKVDHNLMVQRETGHNLVEFEQQAWTKGRHHIHGASLIVRVWRASQYRTISNLGQEARALASLIGVPMLQYPNESNNTTPNLGPDREPEELMRDFWEGMHYADELRNSIPGGMIFLPGRKLPFPGFGWAPVTWMSGDEEAYPYPLDQLEHPTTLIGGRGLVVKYPGYLLYATRRQLSKIIRVSWRKPFEFAVNRRLDEWYRVRATNENDAFSDGERAEECAPLIAQDLSSRIEDNDVVQVAIILSRPRPVGDTGEIGLLVELCLEDTCVGMPREQQLLYCKIIRRVEVSRLSVRIAESCPCKEGEPITSGYGSIISKFSKFEKEGIAGVQLHELQEWCVDGYHRLRTPRSNIPSSAQDDRASTPGHTSLLGKLKKAMMWSVL